MDLSTKYLGWSLPHPFLAGASPLCDSVDRVKRLEDAGIAAVVLRSLFEEQIDQEALAQYHAEHLHSDSHGEASSYLPEPEGVIFGPDEYLDYVRQVKQAVAVPVIASLNGYTQGGWIEYAKGIDQAGADAIELNLYSVATDSGESGAEIEDRACAIVAAIRKAVRMPIAVKLSPFYTSLSNFALRLRSAGADALVLFNRFFEPDIDIEALEVRTHMELSTSHELLLRLRWLAILSGQVDAGLAVSGGVHTARDAIKSVMCGAHAVQLVATLLRGGAGKVAELRAGVSRWLEENGYHSLQQMRGSMDCSRTPDPKAFERGNYMRLLQTWRPDA
ncbi:MAG: dihydroorotate dehydrogenase-like protein [Planctomycetes bacterium]|jgi:dihydroorotate dehydrogenase (fumarate)|nr:dihydroorotate dehydrogenase-like protein [Planctomycetota bacterium]MCC7065369.1 dihydroorotate dehydrogenase-like protein [Planctomycetota bacterium]